MIGMRIDFLPLLHPLFCKVPVQEPMEDATFSRVVQWMGWRLKWNTCRMDHSLQRASRSMISNRDGLDKNRVTISDHLTLGGNRIAGWGPLRSTICGRNPVKGTACGA